MSLDLLIRRLESAQRQLPTEAMKQAVIAAEESTAVIQRRIQSTGTSSTGDPFIDYTPQYKKRKIKQGRYRGVVDYTNTGRMWNNTGVVEKQVGKKSTVKVGGRSKETVDKLKGNTEYRGEVLALAKNEQALIKQVYFQHMEDVLKRLLS